MAKQAGKPGMRMDNGGAYGSAAPAERDPTDDAMAMLSGATGMQRVQTQYQTAIIVTKPRKLADVTSRVMEEASRMGVSFVYAWRVATKDPNKDEGDGKTTIEGVSIEGAMILARNWGNVGLPTSIERETPTHFIIRSEFIDLETGFNYPRLYRQRKNAATVGKMDADRGEDIAFQIAQSKAQRNVIVRALPAFLIDEAVEVAKSSAAEKYADTKSWAPKVVNYAQQKLGVPVANLVHRVRGKLPEQWSKYDILVFKMAFEAIKAGETTAEAEFPAPPSPETRDVPDETKAVSGETIVTQDGTEIETPAQATDATVPATPGAKAAASETIAKAAAAAKADLSPEELEAAEAERAFAARDAKAAPAPVPASDLFTPPKK